MDAGFSLHDFFLRAWGPRMTQACFVPYSLTRRKACLLPRNWTSEHDFTIVSPGPTAMKSGNCGVSCTLMRLSVVICRKIQFVSHLQGER